MHQRTPKLEKLLYCPGPGMSVLDLSSTYTRWPVPKFLVVFLRMSLTLSSLKRLSALYTSSKIDRYLHAPGPTKESLLLNSSFLGTPKLMHRVFLILDVQYLPSLFILI